MNHETPTVKTDSAQAALFALATEDAEAPEQPEVLSILRQSRRFGIPVFSGSFFEWPYISTLELKICTDAEQEHARILAANLKLAAQSAESKNR